MFNRTSSLPIVIAGLLATSMAQATLSPFSENFEGLDAENEAALGDTGWLVFANVFAPDGTTFLYNYGAFPAPNGSGGFSNVAVGQGGVDQGAQQIVVFNDYLNGDHNNGNRIDALVFQQQTVGGESVGQTWTFRFQAKLGDLAGTSTATAFLKTLDPLAGFATTNLIVQDTTAIPTEWNGYELSLTIDEGLVGQLVQFGFSNTASNFEASGVVYDNIVFESNDADSDGVFNEIDNCTNAANPLQQDTDADGHGNICDADFDQNCFTTFPDLTLMRANFFSPNPAFDLNSSGGPVNFGDLAIMQGLFFAAPGPSASGALCNPQPTSR